MTPGIFALMLTLKIAFVLVVVFTFAPVLVWAERRQSAMMQDRIGPVRAGFSVPDLAKPISFYLFLFACSVLLGGFFIGLVRSDGFRVFASPWFLVPAGGCLLHLGLWRLVSHLVDEKKQVTLFGLLHPLADAIKFVFKEDFVPPKADKFLHAMAPIITLVPAILTFAVVPFAGTLYLDHLFEVLPTRGAVPGPAVLMQVANLNVGLLFVFAIAGTGIVGAALAGYASDNKYALLGGLRAAGQMVSYEVTLGLTLVPAFMLYRTLLPEDMIFWQTGPRNWFGLSFDGMWGIIPLFPCFVLFLACSIAETKRIPFDIPEAESELAAGYFTEYSGMKFGMFFMAEFIEVVLLSAITATIFFGGYDVPFLERSGFVFTEALRIDLPHIVVILLQVGGFLVKLALLIWLQLMIRWTLPRFRYDQVMKLCWQYILPTCLVLIMAYGLLILSWPRISTLFT